MSEDLQGLLDRIQSEGIAKAEAQKNDILAKAKAEASKIIAEAQSAADQMRRDAMENSKREEERATVAIKQAARDVLIALEDDIQARLQRIVKADINEVMTPELMAHIISTLASRYIQESASGIEVVLCQKDYNALEGGLKTALSKDLRENTEYSIGRDFSGGLKIGFRDSDLMFDFSDDALCTVICDFAGPKIAKTLRGEDPCKED